MRVNGLPVCAFADRGWRACNIHIRGTERVLPGVVQSCDGNANFSASVILRFHVRNTHGAFLQPTLT